MKTTLELPDDLARRVKIRAAERNQKLKDTVAHLLELGLASASAMDRPPELSEPVELSHKEPLDIDDIEAAIAAGRD